MEAEGKNTICSYKELSNIVIELLIEDAHCSISKVQSASQNMF